MNLGDIIVEGDDIYGDGVNVAARLESIAPPGGLAVSQSVRDQVGNRLALTFEDRGEYELKNIEKPVRVCEVRLEEPKDADIPLTKSDKPPTAAAHVRPAKTIWLSNNWQRRSPRKARAASTTGVGNWLPSGIRCAAIRASSRLSLHSRRKIESELE